MKTGVVDVPHGKAVIMVTTRINNLFTLLNEKGLAGLWERFLVWAWRTRHYVALVKPLEQEVSEKDNELVSFRVATDNDIPWLCRNMPQMGDRAEEIIRQQFTGKDLTLIGVSKTNPDVLAFSVWLSHEDRAFPLLGGIVAPGEVSVRRVWVPPAMRKKGLATLGMEFFDYVAYRMGVRRIWSFVETDNTGSILLHEKLFYRIYAEITIKKRFGCSSAIVTTKLGKNSTTIALPPERVKL